MIHTGSVSRIFTTTNAERTRVSSDYERDSGESEGWFEWTSTSSTHSTWLHCIPQSGNYILYYTQSSNSVLLLLCDHNSNHKFLILQSMLPDNTKSITLQSDSTSNINTVSKSKRCCYQFTQYHTSQSIGCHWYDLYWLGTSSIPPSTPRHSIDISPVIPDLSSAPEAPVTQKNYYSTPLKCNH